VIVEFDHLIVGCADLAQGSAHIEALTGAKPAMGGRHLAMGTHNALLKLGPRRFLELLAIDPQGTAPNRPRWFDLDQPAMREALAARPRLIAWAARTDDIDDALSRTTIALGVVHPMTRGDLAWRITIPEAGERIEDGVMPTLIQWSHDAHPADRLPESGVTLADLHATHREPARIAEALAAIKLGDALRVSEGAVAQLGATLRTPRGPVAL
jgi:Glyoxalase-like domain